MQKSKVRTATSEQTAVRLPHELRRRVDEYAKRRGISRGRAIGELLEAGLDALQRQGLQLVA